MSNLPDSNKVLAESIGISLLGYIGKENVRHLNVSLNYKTMEVNVVVSLWKPSREMRWEVLDKINQVESLFESDGVFFVVQFVDPDSTALKVREESRIRSYAAV